jgi:cellulase/cellobiase CelA1
MGYEINWNVNATDSVLQSPQYQKYSQYTFAQIIDPDEIAGIKTAIKQARASRESASVINFLLWLLRVGALLA